MDIPVMLPPSSGPPDAGSVEGSLTGSQSLGKEDFLLMLVTQLNNQDPLNPLEGHEFAAQLAQFTSVEQLLGLNQTLADQGEMFNLLAETMGASLTAQTDLLGVLTESLNRSAATGLIGMTVEVAGNRVAWENGSPVPLDFELDAPAEAVTVVIRDAEGNVVRSFQAGSLEAGRRTVSWDGTDAEGRPLPEGSYTFEIQAVDAAGSPVGVTSFMQGTVDRVSFGPQGALVWVDGVGIPFADVVSIGAPVAGEAGAAAGAGTSPERQDPSLSTTLSLNQTKQP